MKEKVTIEEKAKNKNNITAQQINEVLRGKIYKPKTQLMMWQRVIKKVAPPKREQKSQMKAIEKMIDKQV